MSDTRTAIDPLQYINIDAIRKKPIWITVLRRLSRDFDLIPYVRIEFKKKKCKKFKFFEKDKEKSSQ